MIYFISFNLIVLLKKNELLFELTFSMNFLEKFKWNLYGFYCEVLILGFSRNN